MIPTFAPVLSAAEAVIRFSINQESKRNSPISHIPTQPIMPKFRTIGEVKEIKQEDTK